MLNIPTKILLVLILNITCVVYGQFWQPLPFNWRYNTHEEYTQQQYSVPSEQELLEMITTE